MSQDQQQPAPAPRPAIDLQAFYATIVTGYQNLLRDYSRERQRLRGITAPTPDVVLVEAEGTIGSLGEENAAQALRLMQYVGLVLGALDERFRTIETAVAEIDEGGGAGDRPPLDDEEAQAILELSALAEGLAKQNLEASPSATAEAKAALNHIIELARAVHTIAIDASEIEDEDETPDADANGAGAN